MKFITSEHRALTKVYFKTLADELKQVRRELYRAYGSHDTVKCLRWVINDLTYAAATVHRMTPPDTPRVRRVEREEQRKQKGDKT